MTATVSAAALAPYERTRPDHGGLAVDAGPGVAMFAPSDIAAGQRRSIGWSQLRHGLSVLLAALAVILEVAIVVAAFVDLRLAAACAAGFVGCLVALRLNRTNAPAQV